MVRQSFMHAPTPRARSTETTSSERQIIRGEAHRIYRSGFVTTCHRILFSSASTPQRVARLGAACQGFVGVDGRDSPVSVVVSSPAHYLWRRRRRSQLRSSEADGAGRHGGEIARGAPGVRSSGMTGGVSSIVGRQGGRHHSHIHGTLGADAAGVRGGVVGDRHAGSSRAELQRFRLPSMLGEFEQESRQSSPMQIASLLDAFPSPGPRLRASAEAPIHVRAQHSRAPERGRCATRIVACPTKRRIYRSMVRAHPVRREQSMRFEHVVLSERARLRRPTYSRYSLAPPCSLWLKSPSAIAAAVASTSHQGSKGGCHEAAG
jgi:hypothetical protein